MCVCFRLFRLSPCLTIAWRTTVKRPNDRDKTSVPNATYEQRASWGLQFLEAKTARRLGVDKRDARTTLASRWKATAGTLENLFRLRVKDISHRIYIAIQNELRREERALEHELHIHRQIGADPRCGEIAAIEKDLSAVRALIDRGE